MDPLRIAIRAAFMFVFVLVLVRASGKRTVRRGDISSFVVAVVVGDLFDDLLWAEVPTADFIVAVGTMLTLHMAVRTGAATAGMRRWLRAATGTKG